MVVSVLAFQTEGPGFDFQLVRNFFFFKSDLPAPGSIHPQEMDTWGSSGKVKDSWPPLPASSDLKM